MLPRFPWHPLGSQNGLLMRDGSPSLALVCYKQPEDLKPVIKIPLDGARVVVEGGTMADEGFLVSTPFSAFSHDCPYVSWQHTTFKSQVPVKDCLNPPAL